MASLAQSEGNKICLQAPHMAAESVLFTVIFLNCIIIFFIVFTNDILHV